MDKTGYFDTTFKMAGDFEFFIRAGREFEVGKVRGLPLAQFRFHEGMQTLNRIEINAAEIKRIHALYPVGRDWLIPVLRLVARIRYMSVNGHRIADKVKDRLAGKKIRYRT